MTQLRLTVTAPTLIIIGLVTIGALTIPSTFVNVLQDAQSWILNYFDWLFDWTVLFMLITCVIVYFSPLGKLVIGGDSAKPILSKRRWYAIVLCTTVATGILFWGCAEPLYHLHEPPYQNLLKGDAEVFAMSTLFMHWSWSPYAIYTLISLLFALLYYNYKKPYRVSTLIERSNTQGNTSTSRSAALSRDVIDIICLIALICGMAASLGAGILTIGGGLEKIAGLSQGSLMWGGIAVSIACAFIMSSISGLHKGITFLSSINTVLFFIFIAAFAWMLLSGRVWNLAGSGLAEYIQTFVSRSTGLDGAKSSWRHAWTTFYWANWMAWAPVTALFLGRLGLGYTVREFIRVNLVYTSLFAMLWMIIFGGVALVSDLEQQGSMYKLLSQDGPQSVIFQLLEDANWRTGGAVFLLVIVFISYVTAADSNTTAMSALCTKGITPESPEAPINLKLLCGLTIAFIAWVMITYAGLNGIRILSVLGGFPILFLCMWVVVSMLRLSFRKSTI